MAEPEIVITTVPPAVTVGELNDAAVCKPVPATAAVTFPPMLLVKVAVVETVADEPEVAVSVTGFGEIENGELLCACTCQGAAASSKAADTNIASLGKHI